MSDSEKREWKRITNEFNVRITQETSDGEIKELNIDIAKSVDVSAKGLLIKLKEPVEMGAIFKVTFLKPNSFDFFEGQGKVVRVTQQDDGFNQLGIEFTDLSDTDLKKLDYYLTL